MARHSCCDAQIKVNTMILKGQDNNCAAQQVLEGHIYTSKKPTKIWVNLNLSGAQSWTVEAKIYMIRPRLIWDSALNSWYGKKL